MDVRKEVVGFVVIVFILLGVLFGMQIMTYIFGNIGTTTSGLPSVSNTVSNETGWLNHSGYILDNFGAVGFSSPVIVRVINATDGIFIEPGNYTLNTTSGTLFNLTSAEIWGEINITYTYNADSEAKIVSDSVVNNSLFAINTYSEQSDTQLNTAAIAITLLILIALFAIFWKIFMAKGGPGKGGMGGEGKNFS